ncbi:MAG: hypothetical protein M3O30_07690 [Planctomycetota bacterium]|nr:hypothetical protein [Planctomycetota bacterium]
MAKAKKPAGKSKPSTPRKTAPAKAAGSGPFIDPARGAAAAAAMVAHKVQPTDGAAPATESSMFRHLKESLNKPHAQTMGGLLDKISSPQQKKSALPFEVSKQVGHNQTVGLDASRRSVPRRTGG